MEFYLICGLFTVIVMATSACSQLEQNRHDDTVFTLEVISKDGECRALVEAKEIIGSGSKNTEVDNPSDILGNIGGN